MILIAAELPKLQKMTATPGEYELCYGNSSAAKDLKMIKLIVQ